jgi:putative MATE family efflux protein
MRVPIGFFRSLFLVALPIAGQNLVQSSVNMVDTIMVGSLGEGALAAVGLGNQPYFLLLLALFGLSTGAGVFTAQYWGARDLDALKKVSGYALTVGCAISAAFTAIAAIFPEFVLSVFSPDSSVVREGGAYLRIASASYLPMAVSFVLGIGMRGTERVRIPLVATVVSLALNVLLNWLLIFGALGFPRLGVEGAALATVVSRWVEALILAWVAYGRRLELVGSPRRMLGWSREWKARFWKYAAPVLANEVIWSVGISAYSLIFSRIGTGAFASFNIVNTVLQLAMVLFIGVSNGAAVMIGKKIGEGDYSGARSWASAFAKVTMVAAVAIAIGLVPVGALLPSIFDVSETVLADAATMLAFLAIAFGFKAFNLLVVVGICRAGGDTRFGMFFDLLGVWGLGVPLGALGAFVLRLPPAWVFLLMQTEEVVKGFAALWRFRSGKWLHDVTGRTPDDSAALEAEVSPAP